jgi:phospholipid/cholesterol/gamma-HCH transport system substrate-binding protein
MSRAFWVGIFVAGTLLILAGGVFLIGRNEFLFSSRYRLKAEFSNVAGLVQGAEVRVGGIRQGTVGDIALPKRPGDKVIVSVDLMSATHNIVKKDSTAAIKSEGLLGSKYVEVSFGSNNAEKLKNGDTIASETPLDISDLIKTSGEVLDSAKNTMQNIESITGKIDQGEGTIGALINDKGMYNQATKATAQAQAGAMAFDENMQALSHNFLLQGFFNRRGYQNSADLTKYAVTRLPAGSSIKTFVYDGDMIFDKKDAAKLKNQKTLTEAGRFLEANRFGLAVVAGYSGMKGEAEKNKVLTQARTMVVREYLVQNFKLDDARLVTIGMGESKESGDGGKIEILIYPVGATAPPVQKKAPEQH